MKLIKKIGLIILVVATSSAGCSKAQKTQQEMPVSLKDKKVLIIYLSRTKNTQKVATLIHEKIGGKIVPLELVKPYPESYRAIVDQVAAENASGFLPELKTKIENLADYDVIFLGFPTWGMQLPPPMKSFLSTNDLTGKTIVPFNTNAGYGIGSTFETLKTLAPKSRIVDGYTTTGGFERDGVLFVMEGNKLTEVSAAIDKWLAQLSF